MKRSRIIAAAAGVAVAALTSSIALSNGLWLTLPIEGQPSFCADSVTGAAVGSTQTGITGQGQATITTVCQHQLPAGETGLTGQETIPMDIFGLNPTASQAGAPIQTQRMPVGQFAPGAIYQGSYASPKNLLRNGDISVNPFQVGTSQAANIANTITTSADGFRMLGGASSAIQWSSQTGATDIVANQFTKSLRFQRASGNTNTASIAEINVLTSQDSAALQGQCYVYSFWAKAGGNFSPTNGNVVVTVASGTGTDQSAANFNAGSWTTQANTITAAGSSNSAFPTSVTLTAGVGTATLQTLPTGATATWVQYWVSGQIGTTATQVGTQVSWTPVGTAGTNDWVETSNHQLEIVGCGVLTPSAFEHHTVQEDLAYAQRFLITLSEPASGVNVPINGQLTASGSCADTYGFPVTMRAAPTFVALGTALSTSTWKALVAGSATALASTFIVTATANTPNGASMTITTTGGAAGQSCPLQGAGGGSILSWTAEL